MEVGHILNHYHKEEHPYVERILELAKKVEINHMPIKTDFIDPRKFMIINNIVNSFFDLTVFFDGGYEGAERGRVLLVPNYVIPKKEELGLAFFNIISSNNKYIKLSYRDYMGALLNLGIKREKFGDILISDKAQQYIVAEEIADYIQIKLTQIGNAKVRLERINRHDLISAEQQYDIISLTVPSLRADTVISHVYNQPRSKVAELIKKNQLKVNWQIINKADYKVQAGDIISLKGFGRCKLLQEDGITKKERIRVKIGKLI